LLAIYCGPVTTATPIEQAILDRLNALEANQRRLENELAARDERIRELEQRLDIEPQTDTGVDPLITNFEMKF